MKLKQLSQLSPEKLQEVCDNFELKYLKQRENRTVMVFNSKYHDITAIQG